ncbi:flagellar basal body L-ring protein FlgH [Comamonas endophytica]|uniref:Flagellar L-ring protein n=1 Tax=Comamonas endophytica TaxID=2949090 RepID=A0ABY6GDI0_9BURK|nr:MULTISPECIES: flagellar basal body L-ring protein FlgH [unclassified Acidovorax]MCD2512720.1 flagellar basal body L-ring protein FlgH [Acidovorax sp. D4N7]UYG52928.1 flagellar basal body L-ring protein FlgH [Acidovorax sp. 5MLIR]
MTPSRLPLSAAALATLLLTGCAATLNPPPPVDILPTAPLQTPTPIAALPATPTGGLFQAARYRPMFEDQRARLVGDMVTVMIVERVTASQRSTSSLERENELNAGLTNLPIFKAANAANIIGRSKIGAGSDNSFSGKGETANSNTFTGSITTTVAEVLPNGHLVVTGEKQIGVNHNVDVLRFSGTVDPRNLQPGSVVSSTQVANVRIESRGRGQQAEAQSIGWLSRFFLNVMPF